MRMSIKHRPSCRSRQLQELRKRRKRLSQGQFKIQTPSVSVAPIKMSRRRGFRRARTTWTSIWLPQWIIWAMSQISSTEKPQKNKNSVSGLIRGLATWRLGSWQELSLNRVMICDWSSLRCNSYHSWTPSSRERRFNCGWSLTKSWLLHISAAWLSFVKTL